MMIQRRLLSPLFVLIMVFVASGLFGQDTKATEYNTRLDEVEKLILDGTRFTEPQLEELRASCAVLDDEGYPDLALRCRFLLFLAEGQSIGIERETLPLEAEILEDEEKGERRTTQSTVFMITGAGFLGAFNVFAVISDIFYGQYLRVGSQGTTTSDDLRQAAYLQAAWEAMDIGAWASLTASGLSFFLGAAAAATNPSSLGELPPPPASVSADPAYETLRLSQEREELTAKIQRRGKTREAMRIGGIVGIGGSVGALGTALVYLWLSDIDQEVGNFSESDRKNRVAGTLGIVSTNMLGTSLIALLVKPNVSRFEDRLAEVDAALQELSRE